MSPAVGVYIGGGLTAIWGMRGVFSALALLAAALLLGCLALMPETRPQNLRRGPFLHVLRRMMGDTRIALAAILVAAFNVSLFSYYSLAPFLFARFDLDALTFGYSGMALAAVRCSARCLTTGCCVSMSRWGGYSPSPAFCTSSAASRCTCCGNQSGLWRRWRWSPLPGPWQSRWCWGRR